MRISDWSSDVCSSDLLDAGQAAVRVHRLGQRLQVRQVLGVPDAVLDEGRDLGGGMDLRLLGADDGPAALRLHAAHGGAGGRVAVAHANTVRHMKHGRAAWWARWMQNVETSVARVSIKKNN